MEKIECPAGEITCPYYKRGMCTMYEKEGSGPAGQCDLYDYDMLSNYDEDDEDEDDNSGD